MRPRGVAATILLLAAALATAWAVVVVLSGGFTLGRLVSRDPVRPLIIGAIFAAIARVLSPIVFDSTFARLVGARERWPARLAAVTAAAAFVVAAAWNTRAAGGSDSSCYVLQADAFARGHVLLRHPLAGAIPGATPAMFAPAGFIPSVGDPSSAVPICAPGLALGMAVARVAGRDAVFAVVPVCAALTVWLTFVFGRRASDDATGAAAACLLACSPIFLYQSVQPMSDVPAALLWLAALTATARGDRPGQIAGGACASLAVLTRPNLALAVVPLVWLLPERRAWLRWGLAAAPAALAFAGLNEMRYGAPLATGYGNAGDLFAASHIAANLPRYARWFIDTETPFAALALAAPWMMRGDRPRARLAIVALVSCAFVIAPYLAYTVFDDWWYLRFLLPILPVVLVYSVAAVLRMVPVRGRPLGALIVGCALGAWSVHAAASRHVFELQALESRFILTGRYAATQPADTVFIAGQHTGSIRYHGDRATLAWDAIPPNALDSTIVTLAQRGRMPLIVLEDAEEAPFRSRFAGQRYGGLDWPPSSVITALTRVRVYDPARAGRGGLK